jgi:hypothetical protein
MIAALKVRLSRDDVDRCLTEWRDDEIRSRFEKNRCHKGRTNIIIQRIVWEDKNDDSHNEFLPFPSSSFVSAVL